MRLIKNNKIRVLIIFLIVFFLIAGSFVADKYKAVKIQNESRFEALKISEIRLINLEKMLLQRKIQRLASDTFVIKDFVESCFTLVAGDNFEKQLDEFFMDFIKNKLIYYQIRYIDENGAEIVRADFKDGSAKLCPKSLLQNKADRYYFTETMKINDGQIYISKLDLNIENGQLEYPLTPMVRISTKVFDETGKERGIVIVNYFAEIILNDFENVGMGSFGHLYLLNSDSYWLKNLKDPTKDFAFMYEDRLNQNFSNDHPNVWPKILDENLEFIADDEDIFFIKEVPLFQEDGDSKYITSSDRILANDRNYFIVSHIEKELHPDFFNLPLTSYILQIALEEKVVIILIGLLSFSLALYLNFYLLKQTTLKFFSERDQLTSILNRRAGINRIHAIIEKTRSSKRKVCIMFIDVNGLKSVNDTLGHKYGDQLIKSVADILSSVIREHDVLFRYGGDEFVLCFEKMNEDQAEQFWNRVLKMVALKNANPDLKYNISISHGISIIEPDEKNVDIDYYINLADENMYAEKVEIKKNAVIIR